MLPIFLQILPYFLIGVVGFVAAKSNLINEAANAGITRFVFYFPLSAMLFRFSSSLDISALFNLRLILAYLIGCSLLYGIVFAVALARKSPMDAASIEAQTSIIGNTGFVGIPLIPLLLGPEAVSVVLIVLAVDLLVFGSLIVIVITASRQGNLSIAALGRVLLSVVQNPMVLSMTLGILWSLLSLPLPEPIGKALDILGPAATPTALFVIGASLAYRNAERIGVAMWLSFVKLMAHPIVVGVVAYFIFGLGGIAVAALVATAALPTAGNVYIVASHYNCAPLRASSVILISTVFSVITLALTVAWAKGIFL